jgi:hypothetical protein
LRGAGLAGVLRCRRGRYFRIVPPLPPPPKTSKEEILAVAAIVQTFRFELFLYDFIYLPIP